MLHAFDISNPAAPTLVGSSPTIDYFMVRQIALRGDYAYVALNSEDRWTDKGALRIFNIANPADLTQTSTFVTPGKAFGVQVSGNYAYVADDTAGLLIIDVSNPAAPALTATYRHPRQCLWNLPERKLCLCGRRQFRLAGHQCFQPRGPASGRVL